MGKKLFLAGFNTMQTSGIKVGFSAGHIMCPFLFNAFHTHEERDISYHFPIGSAILMSPKVSL